jgi:gamma-glutamylcyclotransferase (GGCT)/AIG2-like uncharacterized protein YtfP
MNKRCPNNRIYGYGILKKYRWIVNERGYANIIDSEEDEVHGVVYEISKSDERRLDSYEGVDKGFYEKQYKKVLVNNSLIECLVYVDPIKKVGLPSEEYKIRIKRGIIDSKLDSEYVYKYLSNFIDK